MNLLMGKRFRSTRHLWLIQSGRLDCCVEKASEAISGFSRDAYPGSQPSWTLTLALPSVWGQPFLFPVLNVPICNMRG